MTTGDGEAENLVDNLLSDVDDQFQDLEREYNQAREDIVVADTERRGPSDPLEASNERYELLSQVASLQAELSRQGDELDERDRMLADLGEQLAGLQADIATRDESLTELHEIKQSVLEERREQSRLQALLDARAAERQELADVAHRLQNERDHVQELLTTSIARHDEIAADRVQLDDKLRHIEAARDTAAQEHDARAHELIESRAEMSKLADKLETATQAAADADQRAEKADALAERRANEAGYLNRRIDAMTEKLDAAGGVETEAAELRRELNMSERSITELERTNANQQSELEAANAAVEAIASRTSDYDELVAKVAELEQERDAAWEAASGYTAADAQAAQAPAIENDPEPDSSELADRARELAERARELGARRANEAAAAAEAAEAAAAEHANQLAQDAPEPVTAAEPPVEAAPEPEQELVDLDRLDREFIDSDLAALQQTSAPAPTVPAPTVAPPTVAPPTVAAPNVPAPTMAPPTVPAPTMAPPTMPPPSIAPEPVSEIPRVEYPVPQFEFQAPVENYEPELARNTNEIPVVTVPVIEPVVEAVPALVPEASAYRRRMILPTDLVPNTPEAVAFLLNQPGVTAIVDARSTCGRTGIRPSELFDRVAALRDHFDVPVEVVVTPVSTPVGGAPDLPAIGVHHVTGADTVADRVRALCMGFPADQPLVVVAGDDHVRRAAISEEANVVEPAAVLNVAG